MTAKDLLANPRLVTIMTMLDAGAPKKAALVDEATEILRTMGFVYRQRIPPKLVGIHPANRDAYGVSGTEVADLGLGVVSTGFFGFCVRRRCMFRRIPRWPLRPRHTRDDGP